MADPRRPDVLLMQETKLADEDAPVMAFAMAGYDLIHHGEGAGTASRSRSATACRRVGRRHELRRRCRPRQQRRARRPRSARRTSTRSTRRG